MGKRRDKRRREAEELNQLTMDEGARACAEAAATLPPLDPPALGEPDAPVNAPLKPKPNLRSGAIALPEPEPDDALSIVKAPILPK